MKNPIYNHNNLLPAKLAGKSGRPEMDVLHCDSNSTVATDGYCLIKVAALKEGDTAAINLPVENVKIIKPDSGRSSDVDRIWSIEDEGNFATISQSVSGKETATNIEVEKLPYVEYEKAIPSRSQLTGIVQLNPAYLELVGKTFRKAGAISCLVEFGDSNTPVKITGKSASGQEMLAVIMIIKS